MKRVLALLTLGLVLVGCGQKGALYLPEDGSETSSVTEQAAS